jgi:hypothetical protein
MKDVFEVETRQLDHDFSSRCVETAKDFDLKSKVNYERMSFGFPLNTKHYRVSVEGEPDMIERFKKFMGVEEEEGGEYVPFIAGAVAILFVIGFAIFH